MHKNLDGGETNVPSWEKKDIRFEISELEQVSETLLERLNGVGIEFESLFSLLKESIKTRTYKILFNHKYRDLTPEQLQVLKEVENIKKKVDFLMVDVRGMIGNQAKDILLRTDSIEISQNPLKTGFIMLFLVFKLNLGMKKQFGGVLEKIKKPLALLNNYKQDLYHREYHKTFFERFMSAKFSFNRSIVPFENSILMKSLAFLFVRDIILFQNDGEKISLAEIDECRKDLNVCEEYISRNEIIHQSTDFGKSMEKIEALQQAGKRVFIIIPHPGYLGPLVPRYAMMKTGFTHMANNLNVICGPRVLSNSIIRIGALTAGNIFMTVPSQSTTKIQNIALKNYLQRQAIKTGKILSGKIDNIHWEVGEQALYEKIKNGVFVVAPEGSRSHEKEDGSLELKHCSPDVFGTFIQEGDYVVPFSSTGTEKIWSKLKKIPSRGEIGVSVGDPIKVTDEMLKNKKETMYQVMTQVCNLPSLSPIKIPEA